MDPHSREFVPQQTRRIGVTRRSVSGFFPFRGIKSIEYESSLERDFLVRTEFSLRVRDIVPQPVRISYISADGRQYRYTPDFWVRFNDSTRAALIEVKPKEEWRTHWREWLPKWKAAWRYAQGQGWQFHIHDESRIRDDVFASIRFLQRYRNTYFCSDQLQAILEAASRLGPAPIEALLACCKLSLINPDDVAPIYHLLATRQMDCDITHSINASLRVWATGYE